MSRTEFKLVENTVTQQDEYQIKCYDCTLSSVSFRTFDELFLGFQKLRVITFSYSLSFLDDLASEFEEVEILIGAQFRIKKDDYLQRMCAQTMTDIQLIQKCPTLMQKIADGKVEIRDSGEAIDHRKYFLMEADNGKTRVIHASANGSVRAFNGDQLEGYDVFDDRLAYDETLKDFDTAWDLAETIPYDCLLVSADEMTDDPSKNPIIKKIMHVDRLSVQVPDTITEKSLTRTKYEIQLDTNSKIYDEIFKNVPITPADGRIQLAPRSVELLSKAVKKYHSERINIKEEVAQFPRMVLDASNRCAYLGDVEMDLHPDEAAVRSDINNFIQLFQNYSMFRGDVDVLRSTHFKVFNAIFCSPFFAQVRQLVEELDMDCVMSMPMFMMITSKTANGGKTFACQTAIRMMTGVELKVLKASECRKEQFKKFIVADYGVPIFVDELDTKQFSQSLKSLVKDEGTGTTYRSMLVFAGNDLKEPDDTIRKRVLFIPITKAVLPSDVDQNKYRSMGKALQRKFTNALYREYVRRMLEKVHTLMDDMVANLQEYMDEGKYPDILALSSETLIEILADYGYDIPDWMRTLTWQDDYSVNAKFVYQTSVSEIAAEYEKNPKEFTITNKSVTIELGSDPQCKEMAESWIRTLPPELQATYRADRMGLITVTMDKEELEKLLGFAFKKKRLFFFK